MTLPHSKPFNAKAAAARSLHAPGAQAVASNERPPVDPAARQQKIQELAAKGLALPNPFAAEGVAVPVTLKIPPAVLELMRKEYPDADQLAEVMSGCVVKAFMSHLNARREHRAEHKLVTHLDIITEKFGLVVKIRALQQNISEADAEAALLREMEASLNPPSNPLVALSAQKLSAQ